MINTIYKGCFDEYISTISVLFLGGLLFLSSFKWVPGLRVNQLQELKHALFISYIGARVIYHIHNRSVSFPKSLAAILPMIFLIFFSTGFTSVSQVGLFLDYILIIAFGYALIFHFIERSFTRNHLHFIINLYILAVVLQAAYSIIVSLTAVPAFPLPVGVRPYADPVSALGFSTGPNGYSTSLSIALTISLFKFKRNALFKISTLILLLGLALAIVASGGHGRAGLIIPLLSVVILAGKDSRLMKMVPLAVLSPLILYFILFVSISIAGVGKITILINEFLSGRLAIYYSSIEMLMRNPLGVGFDNFPKYFESPSWFEFLAPPPGAHNIFLLIAIEVGIVAGALILLWVLVVSRIAAKNIIQADRISRLSVPVVAVGVLFVGMLVGRMSPFNIYTLTIWWVCFSSIVIEESGGYESNQGISNYALP